MAEGGGGDFVVPVSSGAGGCGISGLGITRMTRGEADEQRADLGGDCWNLPSPREQAEDHHYWSRRKGNWAVFFCIGLSTKSIRWSAKRMHSAGRPSGGQRFTKCNVCLYLVD